MNHKTLNWNDACRLRDEGQEVPAELAPNGWSQTSLPKPIAQRKHGTKTDAAIEQTNRELIIALAGLLEFCKGNRGNREGNPYLKPEVKAALKALARASGVSNNVSNCSWMDVDTAELSAGTWTPNEHQTA